MKTIKTVDYCELDATDKEHLLVTVQYCDGTTQVFDRPSEEQLQSIHSQVLKQM